MKRGGNRISDDVLLNHELLQCARQGDVKGISAALEKGAWTETQCKDCFNDDLNITLPKKDPLPVAKRLHPFSRAAKLHEGLQFLSLGGATGDGSFTVGRLGGFFNGGMEAVKEAGFDGICFDIELTQGGEEQIGRAHV